MRKTKPLANCEYVPSGPGHDWARPFLLEAIRRVPLKMLKHLSLKVFPEFAKLRRNQPNADFLTYRLKSLAKWASKFHAEADWLFEEALYTMRDWDTDPKRRDDLKWSRPRTLPASIFRRRLKGEPFRLDCEGWVMEMFTWSFYRQSVRAQFERKLAEYEAKSRKLAESSGLVRVQRQYSESNLEWFVYYQFGGLSSHEIADLVAKSSSDPPDESTILKGIKTAAKLIGWGPLRTPRNRKTR